MEDEREKAWQRLEEEISALEGESSCRGVEENEMIGDEGDNEVKKNCDEEHGDEGVQEGDEDRDDDNEMRVGWE